MTALVIVGAGGHGRAVAEAALLSDVWRLVCFVDDGWPEKRLVWDIPVLGDASTLADLRRRAANVVVAIGNNAVRERLHADAIAAGFELSTIVHPSAVVSPRAVLAPGVVVMAGAVIGTEAELGEGAIVNCGGVVDHHCRVEAFGHLGTGARMAGGSALGRRAWMQAGASLGYGVRVPDDDVLQPGEGRSTLTVGG